MRTVVDLALLQDSAQIALHSEYIFKDHKNLYVMSE